MAEAISEVLARYVTGGVVIESTQIADDIESEGKATGLLRVSGYLQVDAGLEQKKQKLLEALWHLSQIQPVPAAEFNQVEDLDWRKVWKEHFQPIDIGEKLVIIPVWIEDEFDQQVAVKIDPGMAFGTGTHPTTQLCLEIMADMLETGEAEDTKLMSMIDVGCGSGILGIAGLKMGMGKVLGVDMDPESVKAAHQNAQINGVADSLELVQGSLEDIKAGKASLTSANIVAANILAPVILRLLGEGLGELLVPGGKLILSGILVQQAPEIESAIQAAGLQLIQSKQQGDWMALVAEQD